MKTGMLFLNSLGFTVALLLSGCASITNTENQQITVAARDKGGTPLIDADCVWKNTKAQGQFKTPSVVSVRRDYAALHIRCKKEGFPDAVEAFNSRATSAMAGNILAGGLIGAGIDHVSGAAYGYPDSLTLWFGAVVAGRSEVSPASASTLPPVPRAALASAFATVDEVDAIPFLGDKGRERYRDWLTRATPRAFAISPTGSYSASWGLKPSDESLPTDPTVRALLSCNKVSKSPCKLYAVNRAVVWTKDSESAGVSGVVVAP